MQVLYWNPDHYFRIPFLGWEMSWYFFFWDLGFVIAFFIGVHHFYRYQLNFPSFLKMDLKRNCVDQESLLNQLNAEIENAKDRDGDNKVYQGFEVLSVAKILKRKELEGKCLNLVGSLLNRSFKLGLVVYLLIIIGTFVGARMFHMISYEHPSVYITAPWEFLKVWKGGRASHGGIIGNYVAALVFTLWFKPKLPFLSWIKLADILCAPVLIGCSFIRVGNFFTQEILGTETSMPWGVAFGHPVDGSIPTLLHPVQLYEAVAYFAVVAYLLYLSKKLKFMLGDGKIFGLGTILAFSARFFLEFFKQEQSRIIDPDSIITMGQILSIPFIVLGFCVYYKSEIIAFFKSKSFNFGKTAED